MMAYVNSPVVQRYLPWRWDAVRASLALFWDDGFSSWSLLSLAGTEGEGVIRGRTSKGLLLDGPQQKVEFLTHFDLAWSSQTFPAPAPLDVLMTASNFKTFWTGDLNLSVSVLEAPGSDCRLDVAMFAGRPSRPSLPFFYQCAVSKNRWQPLGQLAWQVPESVFESFNVFVPWQPASQTVLVPTVLARKVTRCRVCLYWFHFSCSHR